MNQGLFPVSWGNFVMGTADRVRQVRERERLKPAEFAEKLGEKVQRIMDVERGKQKAPEDFLQKIVEIFHINGTWLLIGRESMHQNDRLPLSVREPSARYSAGKPAPLYIEEGDVPSDQYIHIPLYDVRAAAGHGAIVERERIIDALAFKSEWIRTELHANPSDLYLLWVDGESMEPTLRPGDMILVDRREATSVPRDGIYVLRIDSTLLVKRLQRVPGGEVRVTSDNEKYEPFTIKAEDATDVSVVGRVVWAGRRM